MNARRRLAVVCAVLLASACADRQATAPGPVFAPGGGGSGNPTVTSTSPTGASQDTTLDVRVFGTNFDRGSAVTLTRGGAASPKVVTNRTQYVSGTELIANITVALDADTGTYDVEVVTSRGKKGIGTEMFTVKLKGPKPPEPFDPAILYSDFGVYHFTDALGVHSLDLGLVRGVGDGRWARGGAGTLASPYRMAIAVNDSDQCNPIVIWDVDTVGGGVPRLASSRTLGLPPLHHACFFGWSPSGDTIAYAAAQEPSVGDGVWLVPVAGGTPVRVYATANQASGASWSPEGDAIAFLERTPLGPSPSQAAVRVLNRGSGTVTTLVPFGALELNGQPAWSPDGSQIAFNVFVPKGGGGRGDYYTYTIAVTRDASGNVVAAGAPQRRFLGGSKTWSPDGTRMLINGMYIVDVATGTRTRVVSGSPSDWRW